jgi:hypothetical protein
MPGWQVDLFNPLEVIKAESKNIRWYSIESSTTSHLISQFDAACRGRKSARQPITMLKKVIAALNSTPQVRSAMRSRGMRQRFPIHQWASEIDTLRSKAISYHLQWSNKGLANYDVKRTDKFKANTLSWSDEYGLSELSLSNVLMLREDFLLETVQDIFTDEDGSALRMFGLSLSRLDIVSTKDKLSVESYITRCKKIWFNDRYDSKLLTSPGLGKVSLLRLWIYLFRKGPSQSISGMQFYDKEIRTVKDKHLSPSPLTQFLLFKLGDWPIYTIILALV